ncbi:hypothetical protein JCM3766R1_005727 [Sporobolomyces carnicolor]
MNDASPPGYSNSTLFGIASSSVLLNLSPPQDTTSFQLGYLGHGQAFVAGDVQVKFAGSGSQLKPSFSRLVIRFRGIERVEGADAIELCDQKHVLWGEGAAGTSSSSSSATTASDFPPTSSPFKLRITPDLPVCLHLGSSSLEYTLSAELHYADESLPAIVRCSPVHLVRTADVALSSDPDVPPAHLVPSTVSTVEPIPCSVKLPRSVFRRGEAIELVVRIEVPTAKAVGEGLRLRTVSAELVRTISVNSIASGSTDGIESARNSHRTVLAHSGKSARFSPSRPIVIRLMLHPPAELSCESITQSTILHKVSFAVTITIGLFMLRATASSASSASTVNDAVLSLPISIAPASLASRSSKEKEAESGHALMEARGMDDSPSRWPHPPPPPIVFGDSPGEGIDGPVPSYVEHGADDPGIAAFASTSATRSEAWAGHAGEDDEEEYDGYEELSIPTSEDGPPPPAIDDDISPPSPSEPNHRPMFAASLSQDETDPPPDDFAPVTCETDVGGNLLPSVPSSPEPSSPPPPLSPLSISRDDYALPPLAQSRANLLSSPPGPDSTFPTPSAVFPLAFGENLPPPYIGNSSPSSATGIDLDSSRTTRDRAGRSSSRSPPPTRSPKSESEALSLPSLEQAVMDVTRPRPTRRGTSETSLRDPPPYQEEASDRSTR